MNTDSSQNVGVQYATIGIKINFLNNNFHMDKSFLQGSRKMCYDNLLKSYPEY